MWQILTVTFSGLVPSPKNEPNGHELFWLFYFLKVPGASSLAIIDRPPRLRSVQAQGLTLRVLRVLRGYLASCCWLPVSPGIY